MRFLIWLLGQKQTPDWEVREPLSNLLDQSSLYGGLDSPAEGTTQCTENS